MFKTMHFGKKKKKNLVNNHLDTETNFEKQKRQKIP